MGYALPLQSHLVPWGTAYAFDLSGGHADKQVEPGWPELPEELRLWFGYRVTGTCGSS